MTERLINLHRHEVTGILSGRQTQLRRIIKGQDASWSRVNVEEDIHGREFFVVCGDVDRNGLRPIVASLLCPMGQPGDRLWGREIWMPGYAHDADDDAGPRVSIIYRADSAEERVVAPSRELAEQWRRDYSEDGHTPPRWRSPIVMPRWASRILLEVTDVRVERVQDITGNDVLAEGCEFPDGEGIKRHQIEARWKPYRDLWESIHGSGSWDANPWTWVIGFRRVP